MVNGAQIACQARECATNTSEYDECERCDKLGLRILPMRFAYTSKDGSKQNIEYKEKEEARYRGGVLCPRMLSLGFVYLLDWRKGGIWRAFKVGEYGDLLEFPAKTTADTSTLQCRREGHILRASTISIPEPDTITKVSLAYTSTQLPPERLDVLKKVLMSGSDYSEVKHQEVSLRFVTCDKDALFNGGGDNIRWMRKIENEQMAFRQWVAEFSGVYEQFSDCTVIGRNLSSFAIDLANRLSARAPGGGVMIILDDPVGNALEARFHARKVAVQIDDLLKKYQREIFVDGAIKGLEGAWKKAGKDKAEEWEDDYKNKINEGKRREIMAHIQSELERLREKQDAISADCEKMMAAGGTFAAATNADFCPKNEQSCLDFCAQIGSVLAGLSFSEVEMDISAGILKRDFKENLFYRVLLANQYALVQAAADDKVSGQDWAGMLRGGYVAVDEFSAANTKKINNLRQALSQSASVAATAQRQARANHSQATQRLQQAQQANTLAQVAASQASVQLEAAKTMVALFYRQSLPLADAIENTAATLQGVLLRQAALDHAPIVKDAKIFAMAAALWHDIVMLPVQTQTTVQQFLHDSRQALWGATEGLPRSVVENGKRKVRLKVGDFYTGRLLQPKRMLPMVWWLPLQGGRPIQYQIHQTTQTLGDELLRPKNAVQRRVRQKTKLADVLDSNLREVRVRSTYQAAHQGAQNARQQANVAQQQLGAAQHDANLSSLQLGAAIRQNQAIRAQLAQMNNPSAATRFGRQAISVLSNAALGGGLSVFVGAMQAFAFHDAWTEMKKADSAGEIVEDTAKMGAAMFAIVGAAYDLGAVAVGQLNKRGMAASLDPKDIAKRGAKLGGIAGIISGIMTGYEGGVYFYEGDIDAGVLRMVAGAAFISSGFVSTMTAATFLGGPVGWAVAVVGLLIIGVALLFASEKSRDNALQIWLRESCLGTSPGYATGAIEVVEFENIFASWVSVAIHVMDDSPRIGIEIETPPMTDSSAFQYVIEARTEANGVISITEDAWVSQRMGANNRLGHVGDAQGVVHWLTGGDTRFNTALGFNLTPRYEPEQPGHIRWEVYRYNNNLRHLACRLTYWPDKQYDIHPLPPIRQELALPAYKSGK